MRWWRKPARPWNSVETKMLFPQRSISKDEIHILKGKIRRRLLSEYGVRYEKKKPRIRVKLRSVKYPDGSVKWVVRYVPKLWVRAS